MAVTFVASGPQTDVESGNLALNLPVGLQVGDFLVAVVHGGSQAVHSFAGWTQIFQANGGSTTSRLSVWWHRWTGVAPNLTVARTASVPAIGGIAAFRGIGALDVVGVGSAGTDSSIEHASIDPVAADATVLAINGAADDNTRTVPSGWSVAFEDPITGTQNAYIFNAASTPDQSIQLLFKIQATGATGQVVSTMPASDPWASVLIALAPVDPRSGQVSVVSLQVPQAARRGQVSVAAVRVPLAQRRGQVSVASLAVPLAARRGLLSWARARLPLGARRAQVSTVSVRVPVGARRGLMSWVRWALPPAARRGQVSTASLRVPLGNRRGQTSWTQFRAPAAARRGVLSWLEYRLKEAASSEAREMRRSRKTQEDAAVEIHTSIIFNHVFQLHVSPVSDPTPHFPETVVWFNPYGRTIYIRAAFSRIHLHTPVGPMSEVDLVVFRLSDQDFIAGVALDVEPAITGVSRQNPSAERVFDHHPDYFPLHSGDALVIQLWAFSAAVGLIYQVGGFVVIDHSFEERA